MKHSILDKRRDTVENFKKLTKLRRLRKLMKFTRLKKLKSYKVHKVPPSKKAVCGDDCKLGRELQRHRFCESHHTMYGTLFSDVAALESHMLMHTTPINSVSLRQTG